MRVAASVLQLVGLGLAVGGAVVWFGVAGALAGAGLVAVFLGLAMERVS